MPILTLLMLPLICAPIFIYSIFKEGLSDCYITRYLTVVGFCFCASFPLRYMAFALTQIRTWHVRHLNLHYADSTNLQEREHTTVRLESFLATVLYLSSLDCNARRIFNDNSPAVTMVPRETNCSFEGCLHEPSSIEWSVSRDRLFQIDVWSGLVSLFRDNSPLMRPPSCQRE
jgi:hypothetical protein